MEVSGQLHVPVTSPSGKNSDTDWVGDRMGARTSLDVSEERKISHFYRDSIVKTFSPQIISVIITIIIIIITVLLLLLLLLLPFGSYAIAFVLRTWTKRNAAIVWKSEGIKTVKSKTEEFCDSGYERFRVCWNWRCDCVSGNCDR